MSAARAKAPLVRLLAGLVFGVREAVLDRPAARAVLRRLGRPLTRMMLRLGGPGLAPPSRPLPSVAAEPVLRLPLGYDPGVRDPGLRVAVLLHAYNLEVLPEIATYLRNMPCAVDLFVSTDSDAKRTAIAAALAGWRGGAVEIRVVPNRGRNVAPQLITFREVYDSHPYVLLLHTKTSGHTDALAGWRSFLLNNLLGSPALVRGVLELFAQLPELGVLAPRTYPPVRRHMTWGVNYRACRDLADRLGFALYPDSPLDFPAGAMFWARSAALKPLLDLNLSYDDFQPEAGQQDATLAHALERLVFHACELGGLHWARIGDGAGLQAPERLIRAQHPQDLQRLTADAARALIRPGRRPDPSFPLRAPESAALRKAAFRAACRDELEEFLAGGGRLALPTSDAPEVSILLVLYNQAELTFQCLRSLRFALQLPGEVIIADNASSDATGELLARLDGARLLRNRENLHFLRAVNRAAGEARGKYLLLLNNDARVTPVSIAAAAARLGAEADLGAVGGRIEFLDGSLQEAGSIIWRDGTCSGYGRGGDPMAGEFQFRRDVDYGSGAFLMVRRQLFERLGRFDASFAPAYYEETDLCMRIRAAGYRVAYEPLAQITHFEFGSAPGSQAALDLQQAHHRVFAQRHAEQLQAAHHPRTEGHLRARMRGKYRGRLLIVEDQVPYPQLGAGYPRSLDLLRAACEAGWFVTFYPLVRPEADFEAAYRVLPRDVEIAAEQGRAGLVAFMSARAGYYDAAIVSRPHNMQLFREALAQAPGFIGLRQVIYDAEALFALREQARGHGAPGGADSQVRAETALAEGAGLVFAVNAAEAARFLDGAAGQVEVLGHALEARPTADPFEDRRDLLFVGALDADGSPNADSLEFFVREVMPVLDGLIGAGYVLQAAGRSGAARVRALADERVRLLGRVDDLRPLYAHSRVFVAPTRFAAGIPMKVHEAAAAGLPAAATGLLAAQLGWSDGQELTVGDTAEAFAHACQRLYTDETLWNRVRQGALARVMAECRRDAFNARVASALERVSLGD